MKTLLSLSKIGSFALIMACLSTAHAEIAPRMGQDSYDAGQQRSDIKTTYAVSEKIAPRMGVSSAHLTTKPMAAGSDFLATVAPRMKARSLNDAI
jgi:hypothetical protein